MLVVMEIYCFVQSFVVVFAYQRLHLTQVEAWLLSPLFMGMSMFACELRRLGKLCKQRPPFTAAALSLSAKEIFAHMRDRYHCRLKEGKGSITENEVVGIIARNYLDGGAENVGDATRMTDEWKRGIPLWARSSDQEER